MYLLLLSLEPHVGRRLHVGCEEGIDVVRKVLVQHQVGLQESVVLLLDAFQSFGLEMLVISRYARLAGFLAVLLEGRPACFREIEHHRVHFLLMFQFLLLSGQACTLCSFFAHALLQTLLLPAVVALAIDLGRCASPLVGRISS